jgi:hypothetical protein
MRDKSFEIDRRGDLVIVETQELYEKELSEFPGERYLFIKIFTHKKSISIRNSYACQGRWSVICPFRNNNHFFFILDSFSSFENRAVFEKPKTDILVKLSKYVLCHIFKISLNGINTIIGTDMFVYLMQYDMLGQEK